MRLLIHHIKRLVQTREPEESIVKGKAMQELPGLDNAWLLIEDGRIHSYGSMEQTPPPADDEWNARDGLVLPAWCDSHTHLVWAGSRETEFTGRIRGLSYEDIARQGGGILNSAKKLNETSGEELLESAWQRLEEIADYGTGAVEIKSGYGLTLEGELKMLRVIQRLKETSPLTIKATFLGAHAIPDPWRVKNREGYIDLIIREMIPAIGVEKLADYIDVFCDRGFFTPEETARILEAGAKYGLKPKIHANELDYSGGIQVGVRYGAVSVDHLEYTGDEEIECLKNSSTMPALLPGTAFFLDLPYPPARKMIEAGLPLALASDYNPGSTPSGNMQFVLTLACVKMKMTPNEAINAATLNGARAMEVEQELGSITPGKRANLLITHPVPSTDYLPYAYGKNHTATVILNGESRKRFGP